MYKKAYTGYNKKEEHRQLIYLESKRNLQCSNGYEIEKFHHAAMSRLYIKKQYEAYNKRQEYNPTANNAGERLG